LVCFETHRIRNGGTAAVNLIIEKIRRRAHGYRTFRHHRIRIPLDSLGHRTYRRTPNHV